MSFSNDMKAAFSFKVWVILRLLILFVLMGVGIFLFIFSISILMMAGTVLLTISAIAMEIMGFLAVYWVFMFFVRSYTEDGDQ